MYQIIWSLEGKALGAAGQMDELQVTQNTTKSVFEKKKKVKVQESAPGENTLCC